MKEENFKGLVVVKRSGQRVEFNDAKVALAIKKGFDSVYEEYDEKIVNKVKEKVLTYIKKNYKNLFLRILFHGTLKDISINLFCNKFFM